MTDADFKGMHDGQTAFDLEFSDRIEDSKFYDFNQHHLNDDLSTTTGFASAHRGDQESREAAKLGDAARFATPLLQTPASFIPADGFEYIDLLLR